MRKTIFSGLFTLMIAACSIDRAETTSPQMSVQTSVLQIGNEFCPNGGYALIIDNEIFRVCNGIDGKDANQLLSATTIIENGSFTEIYLDLDASGDFSDGDLVTSSFTVLNGEDGQQGIQGERGVPGEEGPASPNGQDALQLRSDIQIANGVTIVTFYLDVDGNETLSENDLIVNSFTVTDGITPVITYEEITDEEYENGAVEITITIGGETTTFIIENGSNGSDGNDGICPTCELNQECADGIVTICYQGEIVDLTLSEFFSHARDVNNGDLFADNFGECFEPVTLCYKKPVPGKHCNFETVTVNTKQEYNFYFGIGNGIDGNFTQYPNQTRLAPENGDCPTENCK